MSVEVEGKTVRIADVDVDESMKENVVQTDLSGDSGAETFDTASVSCPTSSDSDVSPTKLSSSPFTKYSTNSTDFGFRDNSPLESASESLSSKNCESPLPADDSPQKNDTTNHISFENNINIDGKNLQNQINTEIIQYNNEGGFKNTENADIMAAVDSSNESKPPQCENVTDGETNSYEHMEHSDFEETKGALRSIKNLITAPSLIDDHQLNTIEINSKAETISDTHDNSADYQKNNSFKSDDNATANVESLIDAVSLKDIQNINSIDVRATEQKTEKSPDDNDVTDMTQVENSGPNKNAHIISDSETIAVSRNHNKSDDNISKDEINQISNIAYKNLTTSTTSLKNEIQSNSINNSNTPYSRSAENIFTLEENIPLSSEPSTKDLNTDQILSEFTNQKNKVKATQKIIIDTPQTVNIDLRYARIPKEILSQDLGSIAKSVHGIFSSVSGSLKNAYNNTQRPAVKLPIKVVKPVNGKVINEIFEDNVPEPSVVTDSLVPEKERLNLNIEDSASADVTDDETKTDLTKLQIESLERVLAEQRKENAALRERVKQQVDELQEKDQTFKELEAKVDLMCKRAEQALKEKDAAVMRYASVECQAIEAKKAAETAAKNERAAMAEKELLNGKLKSARDERERICQMYDDKCHELKTSEAEIAKLREELREIDGRLKWTQSKLRVEMDAYKECSERAEKLSQQVAELEAARDTAAVNASDSAKAKQFEAELKECRAALILCRHEKEELEKRWSVATQQLETCRKERDVANEARLAADAEIERLKESNLRLEEEAAELAALRAQAALADTLSSQLQRETERAAQAEAALTRESARAETCARREAAALEHAARLTAQHVAQRAAHSDNDAKAQALAADNASLRERIVSLEEECGKLKMALEEETERRNKENRVLARKVAELTEEAAEANKKLEWEKGENGVLKKKHASAIKELNRELQRAMKRVEQLEAKLPQPNASDAPSTRTGSITSLSSGESAHDDRLHNGHADVPDVQSGPLPERQALIERIVSLQRAAARRAERCEFLEEHARHLTEELRAKSRLLRHLLPALPAGALASHQSDTHKKEIARLGGGAMAALWGGESAGMTPELALEVAARLQAVLEDTLLKNITLKENIDTLGEEIARLRKQVNSSNDTK